MSYDVETVKNAANNLWLSVITSLCIVDASQLNGRQQDCPSCGGSGSNDRFRAFPDFPETGGVVCNQCGKKADGIATISWLNECSFTEALESIAKFLRVPEARRSRVGTSRGKASRRTSSRKAKPKQERKSRTSNNAKHFKPTKWNPNAAARFVKHSEQFPSLKVLELLGATMANYLSVLVIAIPMRGEDSETVVGYTIYPAIADGIPYRNVTLSKTTVML